MNGILLEKINADLNSAVKARDQIVVSTLRLLLASLHNARIAKGADLTDEEVVGEIAKDVKRHRESIAAYEAGARADLVDKERKELEVLTKYLPSQLSGEEISKIVEGVIAQTRASDMADMGKVMSGVMAKVKGQADGSIVSRIVTEKLS